MIVMVKNINFVMGARPGGGGEGIPSYGIQALIFSSKKEKIDELAQ